MAYRLFSRREAYYHAPLPLNVSERLSLSGAEGKRLHETQNINLSLSSLGNVLACLSRNATIAARLSARAKDGEGGEDVSGVGETPAPVPYRDSKLTHFLKVLLLYIPVYQICSIYTHKWKQMNISCPLVENRPPVGGRFSRWKAALLRP